MCTRLSLASLVLLCSSACTTPTPPKTETPVAPQVRSSNERLNTPAPVQRVDIEVGAQRSGHSLVVQVKGVGRGHASGQAIENPKAWHITATYGGMSPLRQVLAGPAKVEREPTGAAMGDQWDIHVHFMVAFALPDRAGKVEVKVQAPSGETIKHQLEVAAPAERLTLR